MTPYKEGYVMEIFLEDLIGKLPCKWREKKGNQRENQRNPKKMTPREIQGRNKRKEKKVETKKS